MKARINPKHTLIEKYGRDRADKIIAKKLKKLKMHQSTPYLHDSKASERIQSKL